MGRYDHIAWLKRPKSYTNEELDMLPREEHIQIERQWRNYNDIKNNIYNVCEGLAVLVWTMDVWRMPEVRDGKRGAMDWGKAGNGGESSVKWGVFTFLHVPHGG